MGAKEVAGLQLKCSICAHDWHVQAIPANYFFNCPVCRTLGNLPGVLAAEVDRLYPEDAEKRLELLDQIEIDFPHPKPPPKVSQPFRVQHNA